jgi:RimJ/RimL family protein N-acetyltransferase
MTAKLRPATYEDAQLRWEWANDPVTRQNSLHSDEIPWESHLEWLKALLANPARALYVVDWLGEDIGTCRFDTTSEGAIVSIGLAPTHRGLGLSRPVLTCAIDHYWLTGGRCPIIAYIRPQNTASLRLFKACGFKPVESDLSHASRFILWPD